MNTKQVGAYNSIARYLANGSFGSNKFLVLEEHVSGELLLVAAQRTLDGAKRYMLPGRKLIDIDNCRIIHLTDQSGPINFSVDLDMNNANHTEIITLDLPPMSDQARQAMRARVLAAVRNEMEQYHKTCCGSHGEFIGGKCVTCGQEDFMAWRDAHLTLLRWQFEQERQHCLHLTYQSFPDYCREKWEAKP